MKKVFEYGNCRRIEMFSGPRIIFELSPIDYHHFHAYLCFLSSCGYKTGFKVIENKCLFILFLKIFLQSSSDLVI